MSRIYPSADQLIGHTPLLELTHLEKKYGLKARLLGKLEYLNPAGSVKDRIARAMIDDAEAKGLLKPGSVIIEPTSGNTGIGLASVAAARGYRVIIVMPETMSVERRQLMKAYGAELVLTEGSKGMSGAIAKAEELAREIPGGFVPGQFVNAANPKAHFETTGPEIYEDTDGKVDYFVAGVGTGGTISGTGHYLKDVSNGAVQVIGADPEGSIYSDPNDVHQYQIEGVGEDFSPPAWPAPTRSRASAQASCRRCWIPGSMTRSSLWRTMTPLRWVRKWAAARACWWASPPAPPYGQPSSSQSVPKMRERPLSPSCPTRASATSPRHSSPSRQPRPHSYRPSEHRGAP